MAQDESYFRRLDANGLKHALADIRQALEFARGDAAAESKYTDQMHACLAVIREREGKHSCQCGRCGENEKKIEQVWKLLERWQKQIEPGHDFPGAARLLREVSGLLK